MSPTTRKSSIRRAALLFAVGGLAFLAAEAGSSSASRPSPAAAAEWADSFGIAKPGLTPEVFWPGVVSTAGNDLFFGFSPDGTEAWWNHYGADPSVMKTRRMDLRNQAWSSPADVPMKDGAFEYAHFFSPDGARRYFGCNRTLPGETKLVWRRIWYRNRLGEGWTEPSLLSVQGRTLDGSGGSLAADGTLYFIAGEKETPDRGGDIFICRPNGSGDWLPPERLGPEINSPSVEEHVFVAPDQSLLLFCSRRPTSRSDKTTDIYVSFRKPDGGWTDAVAFGPEVNSPEWEGSPRLSPDGRWLFFYSFRTGQSDVYWADARILEPLRLLTARGPYMGQKPPGIKAERFATGILSTERDEHGVPVYEREGAAFHISRIIGPPWSFENLRYRMAADGSWSFEAVRFDHPAMHSAFLPSRDGRRLYCNSLRPLPGRGDEKIWHFWVQERNGRAEAWRPLPAPINSQAHECQLFEAADGSLYFTSWRDGQPDLMRAVRSGEGWILDAEFGPGVNSPQEDKGAFVSDDGDLLLFWSNRPGSLGQDDIYLSRRGVDGRWGEPINAGPMINSPSREWSPRLSPDGRYLFFLSDRMGNFDIYWIDAMAIGWPEQSAKGGDWADSFGVPRPGLVPEVFLPGLVSTSDNELRPAFNPEGSELWWLAFGDSPRNMEYRHLILVDGAWRRASGPSLPAGITESDYSFSPDGRRLFFSSNRDPDWRRIWYRDRTKEGWGEPRKLMIDGRDLIGSGASVSSDGTLYFIAGEANTPDRGGDILFCRRGDDGRYLTPERLGPEINSPSVEEHVFVEPDQSLLLFSSRRPSPRGEGTNDLYVSFRLPEGGWSQAANLGSEVNTKATDATATLSPDGRWLFFASNRTGRWDIYWVEARILEPLRPRSGADRKQASSLERIDDTGGGTRADRR